MNCQSRVSKIGRETTGIGPVQSAARVAIATVAEAACCTILVMLNRGARRIFIWNTPNTVVKSAASISTPICLTWLPLGRAIRIASFPPPYVSWWRTACRIGLHPGTYGVIIEYSFLLRPFKTGLRQLEKKALKSVQHEYLDWAFCGFSGYIAADELYDGPFCVLSIVDNRTYRRLIFEVLDHDATKDDIARFFARFKSLLDARGLVLKGITTDGSPLYPEPILNFLGKDIPHQICEFHVIAELNKAVLKAVAKVRRTTKGQMPKLPRGRPATQKAKQAARRKKRLEQKTADLFEHRHLFVRHHLTPAQRKTLARITRGFPELRVLREIMDEVYRLFDRRCRTQTALAKLRKLRTRVRRFKTVGKTLQKIFSPNLEKALTFLDDSLLPSTSNAVERGNRRHRKMQKSVYSVRTYENLRKRMALDHIRDWHTAENAFTIGQLHAARKDCSQKRKRPPVIKISPQKTHPKGKAG